MNNDTLETPFITFRWSPRSKSIVVTTKATQIELSPNDAMGLLELLYQHRSELFRRSNDLPDWLDDEPTPGPRPVPAPIEDAESREPMAS